MNSSTLWTHNCYFMERLAVADAVDCFSYLVILEKSFVTKCTHSHQVNFFNLTGRDKK